jgi:hypothetical protein
MAFCDNTGNQQFQSSVISSGGGGSDPSVQGWKAQKINLTFSDVQDTIQEGRAMGTGVWNVLGNTGIRMNN